MITVLLVAVMGNKLGL